MRNRGAHGWQFFVATLLFIGGVVNVIQGLVAYFNPDFYEATSGDLFLMGYDGWGILLALWGAAMIVAGLAVLSRSAWARGLALVLAAVNVLAQLGFADASPLWSSVVIAVNLLAIYGLTAGWRSREDTDTDAGRTEDHEAVYHSGYQASQAAPQPTRSPEQGGATPQQTAGPRQSRGQGS